MNDGGFRRAETISPAESTTGAAQSELYNLLEKKARRAKNQ
jgi:hypothetical protein